MVKIIRANMIVNVRRPNDKHLVVILGHGKHVCRNFERNNVQMTGGWYVDTIDECVDNLKGVIDEHSFERVSIVGFSKSGTGAFLLASRLYPLYPTVHLRTFTFSPYANLNADYYQSLDLLKEVPPTMVEMWEDADLAPLTAKYADALQLPDLDKVEHFVAYPSVSVRIEPHAARRLAELPKTRLIPFMARGHNVFSPLWKTVTVDGQIEAFEGRIGPMTPIDFAYFSALQQYPWYRFHLYTLIFQTEQFMKNLDAFNRTYTKTLSKEQAQAKLKAAENATSPVT